VKQVVKLTVNGEVYELLIAPNRTLLDVLRDDLGLTGSKKGCDSGECGACTVLLDGLPILACITLACEVEGKKIDTIEGLAKGGRISPLQKAFIEHGAIQCGFCTPGMVLSASALLRNSPAPTVEEIKRSISGNLCRCTGYLKIVEAIHSAAQQPYPKNGSAQTGNPERS
jgi:aerobic carbon-monoxide dehydrogenase small subunit